MMHLSGTIGTVLLLNLCAAAERHLWVAAARGSEEIRSCRPRRPRRRRPPGVQSMHVSGFENLFVFFFKKKQKSVFFAISFWCRPLRHE